MTEWSKVSVLKIDLFKQHGFESHYFLMKLFIYFIKLIDVFLNISSGTKDYYFTVIENIYYYDVKLNYSIIIEILPELLLLFFIFFSLINMFNDKKNSIFQYYK